MNAPLPDMEIVDWCARQHGLSTAYILEKWQGAWCWACLHVNWPYPPDSFPHGVHSGATWRLRAILEPNPRTREALNYYACETLAPYRYP